MIRTTAPSSSRSANPIKPASRVSVIVFDWFATLAVPSGDDFWPRIPELITAAGGEPSDDALHEWNHGPIEHVAQSADENTYRAWQRQRLSRLFLRCGVVDPALTGLLDEIDDRRYSREFAVFPDVPATLAALRDRGMRLGLCSNWDWDIDRHLRANEIDRSFDFVVCSASLGYRKPHPTVFTKVIAHAGVAAEQIAFVGDSWHDDIEGARGAGMRPIHIARAGDCDEAAHDATPCISDLEQLLPLLS